MYTLPVSSRLELKKLDNHYEEKKMLGILGENAVDVTKKEKQVNAS